MTSRLKAVFRPLLPSHVRLGPLSLSLSNPKPSYVPALPFFRDPGHTIPTKWSLYRPLLRFTKDYPSIKRDVKEKWRRCKGLTSIPRTRIFLEEQYDLLSQFDTSRNSEDVNTLENRLKGQQQLQVVTLAKTKTKEEDIKPHLTGGFHRPTLFNVPLPRMKPQPESISMTIHNRLRVRERRIERRRAYANYLTDIKLEQAFWRQLQLESEWSKSKDPRSPGGWDSLLREEIRFMDSRFEKENKRAQGVYSHQMMNRVKGAKERRNAWRMAQRQAVKDIDLKKYQTETG